MKATTTKPTRQQILNEFYKFFIESEQPKKDIDTNYADLQQMTLKQLQSLKNNFGL